MNILSTVIELCALGNRQGENLTLAARYISERIGGIGLALQVIEYPTAIPQNVSSHLLADGKEIPALPCSFSGGAITGPAEIITSLQSSRNHFTAPNINYNEKCAGISTPNYYNAPALAVSSDDVPQLRTARSIKGECKVVRKEFMAPQVLVGNLDNPRCIVFSHFDALFTGAVDNASGTAIMLHMLENNPELARQHLFVFDGDEELSYDFPTYWGHGYRVFENRFPHLLEQARRLVALDCVGYEEPVIYKDLRSIELALPLANRARYEDKTSIMAGGIDKLMTFYHSALDQADLMSEHYLEMALGSAVAELSAD